MKSLVNCFFVISFSFSFVYGDLSYGKSHTRYKDPISEWENNPIDPPVILKDCKVGDTIKLRIEQLNILVNFTKFEIISKEDYGTHIEHVDYKGHVDYSMCKVGKYCNHEKEFIYDKNMISHHLFVYINPGLKPPYHKKIYDITPGTSDEMKRSTKRTHKIYYKVDWETGKDYAEIKGSKMPYSSNFNIILIAGIGGAILLIFLMMLIIWKCRIKKTEPIYNEVQYLDLQMNQTNSPSPRVDNTPYSRIKGVLIPKEDPENSKSSDNAYNEISPSSGIENDVNVKKRENNERSQNCNRRLPSLPNNRR